MAESMTVCRVVNVSAGGTWNVFQGSTTTAFNIIDNASLFGLGAEYPGVFAVTISSRKASVRTGQAAQAQRRLAGTISSRTSPPPRRRRATPAAVGAGMYVQAGHLPSVFSAQGVVQAHSSQHSAQSIYLDLVNTGTNKNTWQPAGFYADDSLTTETPPAAPPTRPGTRPGICGCGRGSPPAAAPSPRCRPRRQSWTGPVTSALMNGPSGPVQALTLLNNPPALRVSQSLTTSISDNSATTVPFTHAGTIDTYAAFGTATSAYAAPLTGLYLAFPTIAFASNGTGARYAGLSVTSGTVTTALQGPAYAASGAGAMSVTGVRVLDLNAGDR